MMAKDAALEEEGNSKVLELSEKPGAVTQELNVGKHSH
jgi:hypothetical protein